MIEDGRTVSMEYTVKLDNGTTADSNVGAEPLVYEHGSQQILPAFEREVAGMQVNETRSFSLAAEEAYGPVDPELQQEVQTALIPEDARHEGAELVSEDASGNRRRVRVQAVNEQTVVLDLNHPLAGENLHFEVKVLGIE